MVSNTKHRCSQNTSLKLIEVGCVMYFVCVTVMVCSYHAHRLALS